MVVEVGKIVPFGQTPEQGGALLGAIKAALAASEVVDVSFRGVPVVSTSFVNASFVALLGDMPLEEIVRRIRISYSSAQVNDLIKRRLKSEAAFAERRELAG